MGLEPVQGMWPVTATIAEEEGGPLLRINGHPEIPLWLYGNTMIEYPDYSRFVQTVDKARDAGVHVIMWVNVLDEPEHNQKVNEELFARYPSCYVVFRIGVESPGREGEWAVNENGKNGQYNSYASSYWRQDLDERFTRYIAWLREQPYADRVIGFQPMHDYSGEWFFMTLEATEETGLADDYSEPARRYFGAWLRERYGAVEALREAWQDDSVTFDTVQIPSLAERDASQDGYFKDPLAERVSIDYALFYRTFIPDAIAYTAGLIKRLTGNHCLVGIMYGYNLKMNSSFPRPAATGCFGLGEALRIEAVDFISCPVNYGDRRMGMSAEPMGTFDSLALYGKLIIMENDTRTHAVLAPDYTHPEDYNPDAYGTASFAQTLAETRRDTVTDTVISGGMYWMDLVSRGWWNDRRVWEENQRLIRLHGAKYLLASDRAFSPQMAFVLDEKAMAYITLNPQDAFDLENGYIWHLINYQTWELARSGLTYGYYTMAELPRLPDSVRLILLPQTYLYSGEALEQLKAMKRDGRTIVFMRAPGYVSDEGNGTANMERMTGMRFRRMGRAPAMTLVTEPEKNGGITRVGYSGGELATAFAVEDPEAETLGVYEGTGDVSFARKEMDGWTSVFIGTPCLPAALLRCLGRRCGCHAYLDSERDNLRTDGTLFMFHAARESEGTRTIRLPGARRVLDMEKDAVLEPRCDSFSFSCGEMETRLFVALNPEVKELPASAAVGLEHRMDSQGRCRAHRGDEAVLTFHGRAVSLRARRGPVCGRIGVRLDGVDMPYIDTYAPEEGEGEFLIAYGMKAGVHRLTLCVLEHKHVDAASYGAEWYGFVIGE